MNGTASNPFVWDCTCIPSTTDDINIYHAITMDVDWLMNSGGSITVHASGSFVESTGGTSILFDGTSTTFSNYGQTTLTNLAFTAVAVGHNHANLLLDTALYVSMNSTFMNHGLLNGTDSIYNQGMFMNEGTLFNGDFLNEGTVINTGYIVSDSLYNLGTCNVSAGNVSSFDVGNDGILNITGSGSFFVENDFLNLNQVVVAQGRNVSVGRDFASGNLSTFDAIVENNGVFHVLRDFINSDTLKGSGEFCLGESTTNFAFVKGTLDICDNTPTATHFDVNWGTIEPGVTSCVSGCNVGLEEEYSLQVEAYPNPLKDELQVSFSGISSGEVTVLDVTGRTIFTEQFEGVSSMRLDVSDWQQGAYSMRIVTSGNKIFILSVVK
ncbi:T9SS type A sorting domain-containing protein, partial [Crocinitomicaceae bacterium]|nr:T9SS type A sorting domain-containing protein [Crocinitomicaceae bacterium]